MIYSDVMELVGTRTDIATATADLFERLGQQPGIASLAIASAYWDATAFDYASTLALQVGGTTRLLLWTAGGTKKSWLAARHQHLRPELDVRFIDSPEGGGIFHAKLGGALGADGTWRCALVGSGNLTDSGIRRNVELGVVVRDAEALAELRTWFEQQFDASTPAAAIDWQAALAIVPEKSEAAARRSIFAKAALATPSPAPDIRTGG